MSCRILKRDMEYAMFDQLIVRCKQKSLLEIIGYYNESPKNKIESSLFDELGFKLIKKTENNTIWCLKISDYKNKNKTIKLSNE